MPRPYAPRPFYEPVIYFFSFCAGIICLASTLHSLVRSNGDVDVSTKAAKALGIFVIVDVSSLRSWGYVLGVGAGGVGVNSLILLINCFDFPHIFNDLFHKVFLLTPIQLAVNTLLVLISAIAVTKEAKNGNAALDATLIANGTKIPPKIVIDQGKAAGLPSVHYWDNDYVHFMAGAAWPALLFGLITTFLSWRFYRQETAAWKRAKSEGSQLNTHGSPNGSLTGVDEKVNGRHVEQV